MGTLMISTNESLSFIRSDFHQPNYVYLRQKLSYEPWISALTFIVGAITFSSFIGICRIISTICPTTQSRHFFLRARVFIILVPNLRPFYRPWFYFASLLPTSFHLVHIVLSLIFFQCNLFVWKRLQCLWRQNFCSKKSLHWIEAREDKNREHPAVGLTLGSIF